MRQGFIIAAIALWVVINILGNFAAQQAHLAQVDSKTHLTQKETLDALAKPDIQDSNVVVQAWKIGQFLITLGKTITLFHADLWVGTAIYIYYFLVLPIGISFWVVIALAIRGVGSS